MDVDLERIIQYIKQGDQDSVQTHLDHYNTQNAECFFFDFEERKRRKQVELDEFKKNKVREYVPDSDSDLDSDDADDPDLLLRRRLTAALVRFIRTQLQPGVLRVILRTLRILSRDRQGLGPLVTDDALLTLARLGGINALPDPEGREEDEEEGCSARREAYSQVLSITCKQSLLAAGAGSSFAGSITDANGCDANPRQRSSDEASTQICPDLGVGMASPSLNSNPCCFIALTEETCQGNPCSVSTESSAAEYHPPPRYGVLARGKKDVRCESREEEEEEEEGQAWRREALKALCNIIYNSQRAQERVSTLRLLSGLSERLKKGISGRVPPSGQFYELRLLFLLTALRPELREQLQKEDAALYRHLAALLRHCLKVTCDREDLTEDLQGHTVNMLSALPLQCLDVLLSARVTEGSHEWEGVNMETVHTLLTFMEKRLYRGQKLKEKLTPVLNLLTESCRVHRETRHYLRKQILPPLRDVAQRPEQEATVKGHLVRLMTHVDTDIKHCAAELLFVLCKENVSRFVKYTGYGNAAGLLAARGMLSGCQVTYSQYSSDSDSDTEEYKEAKEHINPVTGRVEEQQPDPMEGMTEQEKEEEARKLISLFNRLSRDNIIQPIGVTTSGKLEPLCGQMRESILEEEEEDPNESEEEEVD
ncbi:synembryn-A isoform X2 [Esox lucius]|uniref:synembryn-A isoform X2 n=1 Tax=Esox lucius TaxID=8010 RepID=UPI001476C1B7|nr:synembryn-A isoform X2 [Esox lucius]